MTADEIRTLVQPDEADTRVIEVLKLSIASLLDDGRAITRNSIVERASGVRPASGRKPGLAKSTLDRNGGCRAIFDAAMTFTPRIPLRNTGGIDAHIARQTRSELHVSAHAYRKKADRRLHALDTTISRLKAFGVVFNVDALEPFAAECREVRAALEAGMRRDGLKRSDLERAARSASLVRRSIARLRSSGEAPTRKAIVAGTAQFNKGRPISDATIDRNADCRQLVDGAIGMKDGNRISPAPARLRHRALAEAVTAERALWQAARRLTFDASQLLREHEEAGYVAEAEARADRHHEAEAAALRMMAAVTAATSLDASGRDTSPDSTR